MNISRLITYGRTHSPDFVIGGQDRPYLLRWWLIPRNRLFNAYLHLFLRSDDDRALHDHPWANASILLQGEYVEHRIAAGGINTRTLRRAGDWTVRPSGKIAHRIELTNGPCWTHSTRGRRVHLANYSNRREAVFQEIHGLQDERGVVGSILRNGAHGPRRYDKREAGTRKSVVIGVA